MSPRRVPPHDEATERALLGAMLVSPDSAIPAALDVGVSADRFYLPFHQRVADAILALVEEDADVDVQTVTARLAPQDSRGRNERAADLMAMCVEVPATGHARSYAETVVRLHQARQFIANGLELVELGYSAGGDLGDFARYVKRARQLHDDLADLASNGSTDWSLVVTMEYVNHQRVEWLWPGRIPAGKLTVLDGDPGLGKSTITLDLAARITTASPLPDDIRPPIRGAVMILSAEDGAADTIRPRLEAAGADLSLVHLFDAVSCPGLEPGERDERPPVLPGDIHLIEEEIAKRNVVLVIIDPLMAYLSERVDSYKDQHVRRAMMPLAKMAERTGAAIVAVRHLRKDGNGVGAVHRGGGSIGIIGAARCGLLVAPDPEDESRRVLAISKCNLAAPAPALAYRLYEDDLYGVARIEWLGVTDHHADDLLITRLPEGPEEVGARDEAVDFLRDFLREGSQKATDVKRLAKQAGIAETTLHRARRRAGVTYKREGFGPGSTVWWSLAIDVTGGP